MTRSRPIVRSTAVFVGASLAGMALARPLQTGVQPATVVPTGRVCSVKHFGDPTPTGLVDPIWFQNQGAIAVLKDPKITSFPPVQDSILYTTSPAGGKYGAGTIFSISTKGTLKVLHDFKNYDPTRGAGPQSGLVDGHDGYLYGTTYGGGRFGVGTIFRIRPEQAAPEILWSFRNGSTLGMWPDCSDPYHRCPFTGRQRADISAAYPQTAPVVAAGGVLYGVTSYSNNQGFGVLYRFAPPYDSTAFHALCIFDQRMLADTAMKAFVCKAKGFTPNSLVLSSDGSTLYGTTYNGITANNWGTVFRASTSGEMTTIHEFNLTEGAKPSSLMMASNGQLYGTTLNGGDTGGGVLYRLNPSAGLLGADFTVMTSFRVGSWLQGVNPTGGVAELKPSGSIEPFLFGTTRYGGKYGRGMLFRIPLEGDSTSLRVLHDFDMGPTGRSAMTAPVVARDGMIYGLTYQGGNFDKGLLYSLNPIVLNDATTHDANLTGGTRALDDNGQLISDPVAEVWVNATASQSGVDPATGLVKTTSIYNGIRVIGRCPNAHIVQFLYRERIASWNVAYADTIETVSGKYPLTSDLKDIHWHTDSPTIKDLPPYAQRNAYFDQGVGGAHYNAPTWVSIFDKPSFGTFDDPTRPSTIYLPYNQNVDLSLSETWRATARDFLICDCQVTKEIWWSREVRGGKATFAHIKIKNPDSDALAWINSHLKADAYAPIP